MNMLYKYIINSVIISNNNNTNNIILVLLFFGVSMIRFIVQSTYLICIFHEITIGTSIEVSQLFWLFIILYCCRL